METPKFKIEKIQVNQAEVIKVVLGGLLSPEELRELAEAIKNAASENIVIISGRLPVWAFAAATSLLVTYSGAAVVGVADPKLAGAVIVFPREKMGEIIPLPAEAF